MSAEGDSEIFGGSGFASRTAAQGPKGRQNPTPATAGELSLPALSEKGEAGSGVARPAGPVDGGQRKGTEYPDGLRAVSA